MIQKTHLGIYALIEKEDLVLLVKKTRGPYRDMWDLPGGRPHHGESIGITLKREVQEETGVQVIQAAPYANEDFLIEYRDDEQSISFHHICLIYRVEEFDASHFCEEIHTEDVSKAKWIHRSDTADIPLSPAAKMILRNL